MSKVSFDTGTLASEKTGTTVLPGPQQSTHPSFWSSLGKVLTSERTAVPSSSAGKCLGISHCPLALPPFGRPRAAVPRGPCATHSTVTFHSGATSLRIADKFARAGRRLVVPVLSQPDAIRPTR